MPTIEGVGGRTADVIHLVGGGSAIPLLRRMCASVCERPVLAGPVEATVVGNAIVQAVAAGVLDRWRTDGCWSSGPSTVAHVTPAPMLDSGRAPEPALRRRDAVTTDPIDEARTTSSAWNSTW